MATGAGMVGTIGLLNEAWYTQYDRAPFHTFNDAPEWLQMDKAGHFFSAYTLGRWGHSAWQRCGTSDGEARWIGGAVGLVYLTGVEVLDGTSEAWGFSWSDMLANAAGAGLFMGQDALWSEQRILVKFSAHPTPFAAQRPDLLGVGLGERILKDYNGQTIWLSANARSCSGITALPPWLNLAFGYGAENMLTAMPAEEEAHGMLSTRFRQFYLSPDLDLSHIKVRSKVWRTVLFVLNGVKVPLPGIEVRDNGRLLVHGLIF